VLTSDDFRENPGTLALGASWLAIFALILVVQWSDPLRIPAPGPRWEPLPVSTVTSHRFGDMTWTEVRQGQAWRVLTATFVHFGLVHVGLNTLGLLNLGRLVEPWYRTGPFLAICYAMGGLGNLVGGLLRQVVGTARPWLAEMASARHWPGLVERILRGGAAVPVSIHTGGGSTILLGLLALGAVVGWRSKTRIGAHLQKQMILLLGLTAVLGVAMSGLVDNYGHLGGAIVGGVIGLFDRRLTAWSKSRGFRASCWLVVLGLSATCLASAYQADRSEADYRRDRDELTSQIRVAQSVLADLNQLHFLYARATLPPEGRREPISELDALAMVDLLARGPLTGETPSPDSPPSMRGRSQLAGVIDRLDHIIGTPWGEEVDHQIDRVRELGRLAAERAPTFEQVYEFAVLWKPAQRAVAADLARLSVRLAGLDEARRLVKK
jgi:rhomboid protease GluP